MTARATDRESSLFEALTECWVCGGRDLSEVHTGVYDFTEYREQDPELHEYTGRTLSLNRCAGCGFGQPAGVPTLPRYFDRMYDQHWSEEWLESEFDATYKDYIFTDVLGELERRVPGPRRRLLDIGAHVGRFIHLASRRGWSAEGVELNPRTAATASRRTGLPIHQVNAQHLVETEQEFEAVTMLDVLEHIPDPVAMLRTVHALLAPSGWAAIKVPCGPGQMLKERVRARLRKGYRMSLADNLVHINHFSPESLRLALERAGFTRIRITIGAPELLPVEAGSLKLRAANALRLGVCLTGRAIPMGTRTPLALNLQAYATKQP